MERSNPPLGHSSTYGRACTHCYKAKCRCLRLKKRCQPSESARRRHAQVAEESDTRIARLEDRMESLLTAMQSFIGSSGTSEPSVNILQLPTDPNSALGTTTSANVRSSKGPTFAQDSSATVSPNPNLLLLSQHYTSSTAPSLPDQVDERLDYFRTRMLPYFPFIDLAPDIGSPYLRQNRPVLLHAIHTVTTFSNQQRLAQVEELKRLLSTSALLNAESNIDLLLGLLTYIAWSTDAFLGRADLVSRLMMLAISIVYDMRLFKPPQQDVQIMMAITQGRADGNGPSTSEETLHNILEKQRAVLACFILSSNISSHLGRHDALRWTPQMEEALQVLTLNESCPTDGLFASQVRLQLLKQKADNVRQQEEADCALNGTAPAATSAPRLLYLKSLRRQLQELTSSFPTNIPQIDILHTHARYVELYINHLSYTISKDPLPLDLSGRLGLERLERLWQSVENIKSWLDTFDAVQPSKLIAQPFHFWSQMILSLTLLKYLSTLKDPAWDCQAVRSTVPLISAIDRMLQKLNQGSQEPELRCDDHLLQYISKLLDRCRLWAQARWDMACPVQEVEMGSATGSVHIPDLDQLAWMQSVDLGDDRWFESVLSVPSTFG
ncbi:putative C6 transcription factor [Aspergillus homomorphus CBS 101889]|uniref:Putative C6 transcription factor n=1 Tax=Aspergillus homomorphus (strain CBS 101889) TaxID=1450537 RepID=A0A395HUZ7_ASPHC|nr:putative C6 transcription factor [Aspergillus homomorphus CBS 101889]RAL11346.1 putative C6 transcription factor [Aspergillus homomorphus CBS 101889]